MRYRGLGNGPLVVSEISFGTWLTVAGGVERERAIACVQAALELGITLFDTANQYGAGEAERVLGVGLRSSGVSRDKYLIATKVFNPVGDEPDKGLSAAQIVKQLDRSLGRLGVDYIDLYQCHRYDKETPLDETLEALDRAVRSGRVRAIGLSEWPAEKIVAAAESTTAHGWTAMTSSQPQYSMLWRKPEAAVFAACREFGLGNIVYSPLAQGVLTGKYKPGQPPPEGSRAADPAMNVTMETNGRRFRSDFLLEAVDRLNPIAAELGLTMTQMALAWVLRRPEVASAIVGASRPEQLAASVAASGVTLPEESLARIDAVLEGVVLR
ncbi:MAG TPA: aldo/keto reductase [Acidobacteriaceae bacterium]|jgi:aryl-alcohol dehydrogenase-like predicted oxidoreductase|nr:aldo/keto reductase [Acidobacteriaceae bacterium]